MNVARHVLGVSTHVDTAALTVEQPPYFICSSKPEQGFQAGSTGIALCSHTKKIACRSLSLSLKPWPLQV